MLTANPRRSFLLLFVSVSAFKGEAAAKTKRSTDKALLLIFIMFVNDDEKKKSLICYFLFVFCLLVGWLVGFMRLIFNSSSKQRNLMCDGKTLSTSR